MSDKTTEGGKDGHRLHPTQSDMAGLTREEIYDLADLFIEKHQLKGCLWVGTWGQGDTGVRDVVANMIVDTELIVSGKVPLERWLREA